MKWIFILVMATLIIFSVAVLGAENTSESTITTSQYATNLNNCISTGLVTFGWAIKNVQGQITGFQGVNLLLGYSAKYFFSPIKFESWNAFWGWGTAFLIIPAFIEIGADYVLANGFYVGIGLTDLIPSIELGGMF